MEQNVNLIREIIDQRSKDWQKVSKEDKEKIEQLAKDFLEYGVQKNIEFDHTAEITFLSHLTTLYYRTILEPEEFSVDSSLFDQLPESINSMKNDFREIVLKDLGINISESELFLVATHFGAMEERLKNQITNKEDNTWKK